ncbi:MULTISPECIES: hypothetical protein [Streptomyces]|uniref:hypothetical protein n=1 Tax=Streptomyces TaxID=1883 RepID=UPI000AC43E98|nr:MULTISPECIES: hypothetical protein [Streptomyces]MCP3767321.1 hypothetical protein [Streptomyces sp. MAR25Y5]
MPDIAGDLHRRTVPRGELAVATVVAVADGDPRASGTAPALDAEDTVIGPVADG